MKKIVSKFWGWICRYRLTVAIMPVAMIVGGSTESLLKASILGGLFGFISCFIDCHINIMRDWRQTVTDCLSATTEQLLAQQVAIERAQERVKALMVTVPATGYQTVPDPPADDCMVMEFLNDHTTTQGCSPAARNTWSTKLDIYRAFCLWVTDQSRTPPAKPEFMERMEAYGAYYGKHRRLTDEMQDRLNKRQRQKRAIGEAS